MSEQSLRVGLVFFGAVNLALGIVMMLAPGFFFDNIGTYGARNDHFIGDLGAFYIAAGGGLLVSVRRPSWRAPLLYVSAAWYALHAVNHLFTIGDDNKGDGRGIADTVVIAVGAAALFYLGRSAQSDEGPAPPAGPPRGLPPRPADYPPGD
ncbi:MAG: hypothetical protein QOD60_1328 [Solirubrobacterales bacterium]|jgi:hypothetical protein|nr:hypothetical protein [Solirubrobacterales bacterium]